MQGEIGIGKVGGAALAPIRIVRSGPRVIVEARSARIERAPLARCQPPIGGVPLATPATPVPTEPGPTAVIRECGGRPGAPAIGGISLDAIQAAHDRSVRTDRVNHLLAGLAAGMGIGFALTLLGLRLGGLL